MPENNGWFPFNKNEKQYLNRRQINFKEIEIFHKWEPLVFVLVFVLIIRDIIKTKPITLIRYRKSDYKEVKKQFSLLSSSLRTIYYCNRKTKSSLVLMVLTSKGFTSSSLHLFLWISASKLWKFCQIELSSSLIYWVSAHLLKKKSYDSSMACLLEWYRGSKKPLIYSTYTMSQSLG